MIEYWNIYDVTRNKIGQFHHRGLELEDGQYHLVVAIWIRNKNNEILLTKRNPEKQWGNYWECTGGSPELWHRKVDMMEATLNKLAETSPEFAERMFLNLAECICCYKGCKVKTLYEFKGKKKFACHGLMELKMCVSDFEDVKVFINAINESLIESTKLLECN